ncbi:MAG: glycosyltransferase [Acidimicrobiales bacterium]
MSGSGTVVHLLKGLGPGGAERLLVAQLGAPSGFDHVVAYLVPEKRHLVPELEEAGVAAICLDGPRIARPGWIVRLRALLVERRPVVVHVHSPAVAAVVRVLARTLRRRTRPVVLSTEHNRWPRHHRLTRLANRLTIRAQPVTVAVSDDVKASIRGTSAERVRVIVHGIDQDAVRAMADRPGVRTELGIDEHEVLALCVANLRREKALDMLVESARLALGRSPALRFVLVGQGPLATELDGWIEAAGIGHRFTALGYRDDAPRLMSGADLFTLSSTHEGLPVAIMEALTLGLPVVATAAGGVPAAVGSAGIITPIGDAAALADAQVSLAADPARRRRLAEAATREAERFAITRAAAELEQLYRELSGGRHRYG